jgi:hypothetical protein
MTYTDFTLDRIKQQFRLNMATGSFFGTVPRLVPREWLTNLLDESIPLAVTVGTGKMRSESIVAPLLFELRQLLDGQIGLFSGMDFTVDPELGLEGECDFLLTRSPSIVNIEVPAIAIVQAEKGDFNASWGQCAAQMIAAQKLNLTDGQDIPTIYGSVTTGTQWQFLKLTGQDLTIDVTEYSLNPVDRILGILKWMLDGGEERRSIGNIRLELKAVQTQEI